MSDQKKIDLFKQFKGEYKAGGKPVIIQTTPAQYLAVTGEGKPGGKLFQELVGALYSMAFTIKMTRKAAGRGDYVICKLECLWWSEAGNPAQVPLDQWQWQLLIRTPDFVDLSDVEKAAAALLQKGKVSGVSKVNLVKKHEGQCVQMLHLGPYDKEEETFSVMEQFLAEKKLLINGRHHEIYLSDPRRVPPERLKTILRLPVK